MVKCRDLMERIQDLFNKWDIKYKTTITLKAPAANVMVASHSSLSIETQLEKVRQDTQFEEEMIEEVKDTKCKFQSTVVRPISIEEDKKNLPTPPPSHVYKAHVISGTRPCQKIWEGKKHAEEKMENQPNNVLKALLVQEWNELKQHKRRWVHLLFNFGGDIWYNEGSDIT